MKTKHDITYKPLGTMLAIKIPKGTPVFLADNLPNDEQPQYWVKAWDSLPEIHYRWVDEIGCLLDAHEVEV